MSRPSTPKALEHQAGGDHYRRMAVQPWDAMLASRGPAAHVEYHIQTSIKYAMRAGHKGPLIDDVRKAHHHLQRAIEVLEEVLESETPQEGITQ